MEHAIRFIDRDKKYVNNLVIVSISDIHFGAMNPKYQYDTLKEQFVNKLYDTQFDVLAICGDYFHHKFMSNSDAIMYGLMLWDEMANLCISKSATMVIIHGTKKHDDDQLQLFYTYLKNPLLDLRIVEQTRFEYIKGMKVLCIPEEYNKTEEYYYNFLYMQGYYDLCIVHGMYKGAVYQNEIINVDNSVDNRVKIFNITDFAMCRGLILAGHVHTPGCFNSYFYYCGSPYRWQFGEEHDKGFLVTLLDLESGQHYTHFETIDCLKYVTINLDDMMHRDPDFIINEIQKLSSDIDFIRLEINSPNQDYLPTLEILKTYYRNNTNIKLNVKNLEKERINNEVKNLSEQYSMYDYLINDKSLTCYDKLARYINQMEGTIFITVEELIDILKEE